jgi:hypothetical protein
MKIKYTHRVIHKDGGVFFAKLETKGHRMYVSDVTKPDGTVTHEADDYECRDDTVEEYFSTPPGWWVCAKLNAFKGNK